MTPAEINKMFDMEDYSFYLCDFERNNMDVARDLSLWIIGNINAEDIQHQPDWDYTYQYPTSYGGITIKGCANPSQAAQWAIIANRLSLYGQGLIHNLTFAECDLDAFHAMKTKCKDNIELMTFRSTTRYQLDFQKSVLADLECLIKCYSEQYPNEIFKILKGQRNEE